MNIKRPSFLHILVFITGMAITAVEITASRALAPYFGTSLFVWANIIGSVLLALAIGYSIGGKLADARPSRPLLLLLVLAAGIWTAFIPLFIKLVAPNIALAFIASAGSLLLIAGSFIVAVLVFVPPVFLLAMVSPFALRLATKDVASAGHVAGSLYSVSTVGSLIGIFLPSFILIPFVGVRETFIGASALLILIAASGLGRRSVWVWLFLLLPFAMYIALQNNLERTWNGDPIIEERESVYQHLRVTDEPEGTVLRINDGIGFQSMYHKDRLLYDSYFDYYTLLPFLIPPKEQLDVLLVGLAGGTIARQYDLLLSDKMDIAMDGIEIDPEIVELARKYFDVERDMLSIHVADGRQFMQYTKKQYDIIIVDAYSQQLYIPSHMATVEFFELAKSRLRDSGIFAINVNAFRDDAPLLQRMSSTLQAVFPEVYTKRLPEMVNILMVAGREKPDIAGMIERAPGVLAGYAATLEDMQPASARAPIFTDNRAPTELLTESMFFDLLTARNST